MPGRPGGLRPAAIVIHISEGTLSSADAWFNNEAANVSAHYCVGRVGEIHQYVSEEDTAYHAGSPVNPTWRLLRPCVNPNFYTIGIEHEGRAQDPWVRRTVRRVSRNCAPLADLHRCRSHRDAPRDPHQHFSFMASKPPNAPVMACANLPTGAPPATQNGPEHRVVITIRWISPALL